MKITLLLLLTLILNFTLPAQDRTVYVYENSQLLKWGAASYENSLNGITALMSDLQIIDPALHEAMDSKHKSLLKQRRNTNVILGVGMAGGVGLMLAGAIQSFPEPGNNPAGLGTSNQKEDSFKKGAAFIVVGGLIGVLTSAVYSKKRVNRNDLFDFKNTFNRQSDGDKIELSFSPVLGVERGSGMAGFWVGLRF